MNNDNPNKRSRGRPRNPKPEGLEQPRRPRGRPALGEKSKSVSVTLRVTREEYELFKQLAKEQDKTLRDFILCPLLMSLQKKGCGNNDCM